METKSLELYVMNCKGLRAFNFFQKLSAYAVVSILSDDRDKTQQQRTPTDREGGANPEWDHNMRFNVSEATLNNISYDHLFLVFDLRSEGFFSGKSIGEVRVPLNELIDESGPIVRFVSYEIRNSDGKPNGVLNFSFKVEHKGRNYPILHPNDLSHSQKLHPDCPNPYSDIAYYPNPSPPVPEPAALHPSPMELLIPSSTHEFSPIRYPSITLPTTEQPYPFQESLYPPVELTPPEPFPNLHSRPPWTPQCPPSGHPGALYGYTSDGYNYSCNSWEARQFQSTAVDCGCKWQSGGWMGPEQ